MRTLKQIQNEVKRLVKKQVSPNEITEINISGDVEYGSGSVTMESTCVLGETMTWQFIYSYEPSNEDCFSEIQRIKFPEKVTKEKFEIKIIS